MSNNEHTELITSEQFAKATGVSRQTIHRWRQAGVITPQKIGKRLFYTLQDIETFKSRREAEGQQPKASLTKRISTRSKASDRALRERAVNAVEIIAAAQVAQALALGKFGAATEFDAEGLRSSAAGLLDRLGISPRAMNSD